MFLIFPAQCECSLSLSVGSSHAGMPLAFQISLLFPVCVCVPLTLQSKYVGVFLFVFHSTLSKTKEEEEETLVLRAKKFVLCANRVCCPRSLSKRESITQKICIPSLSAAEIGGPPVWPPSRVPLSTPTAIQDTPPPSRRRWCGTVATVGSHRMFLKISVATSCGGPAPAASNPPSSSPGSSPTPMYRPDEADRPPTPDDTRAPVTHSSPAPPPRHSACLARYVRLHAHSYGTLCQLGALLLVRELAYCHDAEGSEGGPSADEDGLHLGILQQRYHQLRDLRSRTTANPQPQTASGRVLDGLAFTIHGEEVKDPETFFHAQLLLALASQLLPLQGGKALQPAVLFAHCCHEISGELLAWRALSHLLQVPLIWISPVLWLPLLSVPTAMKDETKDSSTSCSATASALRPSWEASSSAFRMFAFSSVVSPSLRPGATAPPLPPDPFCRLPHGPQHDKGLEFPVEVQDSIESGKLYSNEAIGRAKDRRHDEQEGYPSFLAWASAHLSSCPLSFFLTPLDAASLATVAAAVLNAGKSTTAPQHEEPERERGFTRPQRWLDLCCSPGMKLQALAEHLALRHRSSSSSSSSSAGSEQIPAEVQPIVLGTDIDLQRLNVARSLLEQYHRSSTQVGRNAFIAPSSGLSVALFHADGSNFSVSAALEQLQRPGEPPLPHSPQQKALRTEESTPYPLTSSHVHDDHTKEAEEREPHKACDAVKRHRSPASSRRAARQPDQGASSSPHSRVAPLRVSEYSGLTAREAQALKKRQREQQAAKKEASVVSSSSTCEQASRRHQPLVPLPVYVGPGVRAALSQWQQQAEGDEAEKERDVLFDGVLVDVECTHDGSLAHLDLSEAIEKERWASQQDPPRSPPTVAASRRVCGPSGSLSRTGGLEQRSNVYRMAHLNISTPGAPTVSHRREAKANDSSGFGEEDVRGPFGGRDASFRSSEDSPLFRHWPQLWPLVYGAPASASLHWQEEQEEGDQRPSSSLLLPRGRNTALPYLAWLQDNTLLQLQLSLLLHAFALLKPGGRLVYSTCSMSFQQNEYVICCFLKLVGWVAGSPSTSSGVEAENGETGGRPALPSLFPGLRARLVAPFTVEPPLTGGHGLDSGPSEPTAAATSAALPHTPETVMLVRQQRHLLAHQANKYGAPFLQFIPAVCLDSDETSSSFPAGTTAAQLTPTQGAESSSPPLAVALQQCRDAYGVVSWGEQQLASTPAVSSVLEEVRRNSVRFWPLAFKTSFQYVAVVEKWFTQCSESFTEEGSFLLLLLLLHFRFYYLRRISLSLSVRVADLGENYRLHLLIR
eukprot:gene12762-8701_t